MKKNYIHAKIKIKTVRVNQFEPANEPVVITPYRTENPNFARKKIRKKQKNGSHVNDFRGNSLSLPP